jgi:hypothetical protein
VIYGDLRPEDVPDRSGGIDVLLSLKEIPGETRNRLTAENVTWVEIARKEQSLVTNEFGDEVSLFLKRYGVRTLRV